MTFSPDTNRFRPGDIIGGKYHLIRVAGSGGMATVWRALNRADADFTRPVAVKAMHPQLAEDHEFARMFVEEARVVSGLLHPNVVQVLDFIHDDKDGYFIVMEWIEGIDLRRWLLSFRDRKGLPPWDLVALIGTDILRALAAAHGSNEQSPAVFHRDVTPANILIGQYGEVKLADFGLSRAMDRITLTVPGVVKGKLPYVAPEMLAGARASAGSDLYSLGIGLWECLAGQRLYNIQDPVKLFVAVGQAAIPSLAKIRSDLPEALLMVMDRLLKKEPEDRFASAQEAADALENCLPDAFGRRRLIASLAASRMETARPKLGNDH